MKAYQAYLHFFKLLRKSRTALTDEPRKPIRKVLAETLRRLFGAGDRLRATLGEETD